MKPRHLLTVVATSAVLVLAGCSGGSDDPSGASKEAAANDETAGGSGTGSYCARLAKAGGDIYGVVPLFGTTDAVKKDVEHRLSALEDAAAGGSLKDDQTIFRDYLISISGALVKTAPGDQLNDPTLGPSKEVRGAQKRLSDDYLEHCK